MNRIWFVSTVYGDLEKENKLIKDITKWRFKPKTEAAFKKIGFDKEQIQIPLIGSRHQVYQLKTPDGLILPYTKMVAKGCSVRNNFHILINKFKLEDEDLIIFFDGDGQIDYNHTFKIAEALKDNQLIISNRINGKGISDNRNLVEKFENSFIEKRFNITLPDAQCGCWGLKGSLLKKIYDSLSAEGFEIELDLIMCSLEKEVKPFFVDIELIEKTPNSTTFKVGDDDLMKLAYLMRKCKIDVTILIERSQVFAKSNKPLHIEYTRLFTYDKIKRITF